MECFWTIYLLVPLFYATFHIFKLIFQRRDHCCYMLHYECYKATDDRKLDTGLCAKIVYTNKNLGLEEYQFLLQTMVSSGIGEETYSPKNIIHGPEFNPTLSDSLLEMDEIFFETLDNLFSNSGISPSEIDILVVNVSLISVVPSLTARIINRYKLKAEIKAFNLSGMGCSASLVAIDLVQNLFKCHKNSIAIVVSTESMGPNWYCGKEKSMMLSNCLFRSGGCSMILTNKRDLKERAILKLKCLIRTHTGSNDEAHLCCMQVEDDDGYLGFRLTKSLTKAASQALSKNLRVLVPQIIPIWKLIGYVGIYNHDRRKMDGVRVGSMLKTGINHFCIHPGGRAVIDGVGMSLGLSEYDLEPARMALHRFGNTSSGGLWYVLGYMEAKKRLKRGDQILMISLGAGFKCNNCVWEVLKDLGDENIWKDCIESYPMKKTANPFMEKYGWINNEPGMSFIRQEGEKLLGVH